MELVVIYVYPHAPFFLSQITRGEENTLLNRVKPALHSVCFDIIILTWSRFVIMLLHWDAVHKENHCAAKLPITFSKHICIFLLQPPHLYFLIS